MRIKPMLRVLGCAKINVHVYVTEASLHAHSMGVGGPGCLSCLGGRRLSMAMCMTHLGMTYFVCIRLSFYPCAGMSVCLVSFVARKPRTTCQLGRRWSARPARPNLGLLLLHQESSDLQPLPQREDWMWEAGSEGQGPGEKQALLAE